MRKLKQFITDESGSTAIEYAVILILCSTAMIAALYSVRTSLSDFFASASAALQGSL